MRISEYLPWLAATFGSLLIVTAIVPNEWSNHTKFVFRAVVAVVFFFLIGTYWLATGEKFDETAYRLVLCRLHEFDRCAANSSPSNTPTNPLDATALEEFRRNEARREKQLRETKDAIARLEAAQKEQTDRANRVPDNSRSGSATTVPLCVTFNGRRVCE